jgi:hypothetical protein
MPSALTVSGLLRIDCALTNTQTIGSVEDASVVLENIAFANGTGASQANIYIRKSGSVVSNGSDTTTLASVTVPTQSGTTYTASIDRLRMLYVKNTSAAQFLRVVMANTADDSIYDAEVHPGGVLFWSVGVSTVESAPGGTAIDKVTIYAPSSNTVAAAYDMVLVGTKT